MVICGSHLILHMRKASTEEARDDTSSTGEGYIRPSIRPSAVTHRRAVVRLPRFTRRSRSVTRTPNDIAERATPLSPPVGGGASRRPPGPVASAVVEMTNIRKLLDMAQKIGLPPPLTRDLESMWYDPVATINHGMTTIGTGAVGAIQEDIAAEEVEMGPMSPTLHGHDSTMTDEEKDTSSLPSQGRFQIPARLTGLRLFSGRRRAATVAGGCDGDTEYEDETTSTWIPVVRFNDLETMPTTFQDADTDEEPLPPPKSYSKPNRKG